VALSFAILAAVQHGRPAERDDLRNYMPPAVITDFDVLEGMTPYRL
jgi:hypothetical protein